MNLTPEQNHPLENGQAVNVLVDGAPCVVVRRDKYDRVIELIQYDDAELDPREMYPAILNGERIRTGSFPSGSA